jgi:methyl-accepting chemotaxis protein
MKEAAMNATAMMRAVRGRLPSDLRLGVRGRLFTAFGAVAALTVGASAAGYLSYAAVGNALGVIERDALPAIGLSLRLSNEAAQIAADGPRLLGAATPKETSDATQALDRQQEKMSQAVAALANVPGQDVTAVWSLADDLQTQLRQLAGSVQERLALAAEVARIVKETTAAHRALVDALTPLIDAAASRMQIGPPSGTAGMDAAATDTNPGAIAGKDIAGRNLAAFQAMLDLRAEVNLVPGLFGEVANAPEERLAPLKDRFAAAADRIASAMKAVPDAEKLSGPMAALLAGGNGARSIFDIRRGELKRVSEGKESAAATAALTTKLNDEAARFVAAAEDRSQEAVKATKAAIDDGKLRLAAFAAGSLLAALLIAWLYVARNVVRRLAMLRAGMLAIAGGDLDAAVPQGGRDEIAEMADTVRVFRDNGRAAREAEAKLDGERQAMAEQRRHELMTLAQSFETSVHGLVESLSGAAGQMRSAAETMVATADETNGEAAAIGEGAAQASANVQTVAAAAEELSSSIGEIGRQVAQSTAIASKAVATAEDTNTVVEGLAAAVQKIGDVATLISGIAGQTNLLALNATIEAARAGEAGKGFAVVAGEVKNLASQTAKATEEITTQINDVCQRTERVVAAIRAIGGTIGDINGIATTIAAAVEEQDATTREIARNIQEAASVTEGVSGRIAGVTAAAGRTGETAQEVLGSASALAEESAALSDEVERFLGRVRAG